MTDRRAIFLVLALTGCETRRVENASKPAATAPTTIATAPGTVTSKATATPTPAPKIATSPVAFESVVLDAKEYADISLFSLGDRILVENDEGSWGYGSRKGKPTRDPSLTKGLPKGPPHRPAFRVLNAAGRWPQIALTFGADVSRAAAPNTRVYARRDGTFATLFSPSVVPSAMVVGQGVVYALTPEPFYFINGPHGGDNQGQPLYACSGVSSLPVTARALTGASKVVPQVPKSFFLEDLSADGAGNAWMVGGDSCKLGNFIASLGQSTVKLELVPGSDACQSRTPFNSLSFTRTRLFSASRGGLHALVSNVDFHSREEETAKLRVGACAAPSYVIARDANGTWSAPRVLPSGVGEITTIDEAGTAWAITSRSTVVRIPENGPPSELKLAESCLHPPRPASKDGPLDARTQMEIQPNNSDSAILRLVVPFSDQPWIVVHYDSGVGVCYAPLDR